MGSAPAFSTLGLTVPTPCSLSGHMSHAMSVFWCFPILYGIKGNPVARGLRQTSLVRGCTVEKGRHLVKGWSTLSASGNGHRRLCVFILTEQLHWQITASAAFPGPLAPGTLFISLDPVDIGFPQSFYPCPKSRTFF